MDEFALIARLVADLPTNASVLTGPGDDCAVLEVPEQTDSLLFKTDAVVEGIHFTRASNPEKVGHKALGRCLSDIAAMGGTPLHALVTLGLPDGFDPAYVERIYAGMNALAKRFEVAIVGGETVRNPERIFLSLALLGKVPKGKCIVRSGAKPGDALFVSGTLGGSLSGRHLEFEPRLAEARWLSEHAPVHAMIDLSDGLAGDLRHLLKASNVGAEILASAIPISQAARLRARASPANKAPLLAALTDGEDFELLFAVPGPVAVELLDGWKQAFPNTRLSCIGKVNNTPGRVLLCTKEGVRELSEHGYVHFS